MSSVELKEPDYIKIGKRIKSLRELHEMKQSDLAAKLGISRIYLYLIENGKSHLGIRNLMNISEVLNISCDELLYGADSRNIC